MSAIIFISRQLSLTKKIFLVILMMLQLHSAFADNENYDGQDVSGKDFSGKSHKNSSWVSSTASGTIFSTSENATSYSNSDFTGAYLKNANFKDAILSNTDFTDAIVEGANFNYSSPITSDSKLNTEQLYSTASYKNKNLTGCGFANIDLTKCNFTGINLTNVVFTATRLAGCDFTDAIIEGASFAATETKGFNQKQLYSTASYKNKNLRGVSFARNDLLRLNGNPSAWDFTGQDLTNADFSYSLISGFFNSISTRSIILTDAIIEGANFEGLQTDGYSTYGISTEQLYSTASYKNKNLTGIKFGDNCMVGFDFTGQNMTNVSFLRAELNNADFTNANLTNVSFWGAELNNADFTNANLTNVDFRFSDISNANFDNAIIEGAYLSDIRTNQLYSTASYKEKNLKGVTFSAYSYGGWLAGADFAGQNLMNADFTGQSLNNTDFTKADLRGGTMKSNYVITKNTIMGDGRIKDFSMVSSDDSFSIRKYTPAAEGGEMISAKIGEDATISGGAELALENGAELEVIDAASLSVANGSSIIINTDADSSTSFKVNSGGGLAFENGAILEINVVSDLSAQDILQIEIMEFAENASIAGLDTLVKGETILLNVNGSEWLGEWDYALENNQMLITVSVPEPAVCAAAIGALALGLALKFRNYKN